MVQRLALVSVAAATMFVASAVHAQTCTPPGTGTSVCSGDNCAQLTVGSASGSATTAGAVPITFTQGADNSEDQRGSDDVAAIAFTVGLPGTGTDAPLRFACTGGNLADGAVAPGAAIANDFTVVVENAQCNNRSRCLCPDEGAGQQRDNFVNIAVYGPKTLPEQGPVTIPKLPANDVIVTLNLKSAIGVAQNTVIPLHVFSAMDASKPQFAANLSIGDQSACDVTAAGSTSTVKFVDGHFTVSDGGTPPCTGDCNGDKSVAINELITGVNIALGSQPVSACPSFDSNGDGSVAINELISAVNNALNGCPA
ncbi:MAG: hypothetical protein ABI629_07405 [bacterium]